MMMRTQRAGALRAHIHPTLALQCEMPKYLLALRDMKGGSGAASGPAAAAIARSTARGIVEHVVEELQLSVAPDDVPELA